MRLEFGSTSPQQVGDRALGFCVLAPNARHHAAARFNAHEVAAMQPLVGKVVLAFQDPRHPRVGRHGTPLLLAKLPEKSGTIAHSSTGSLLLVDLLLVDGG